MSSTRAPASAPARPLRRTALGALLLGATAALALAPGGASAMGLPRSAPGGHLTVAYDDGSGHHRTYRVDCGDGRWLDSVRSGWEGARSSDACRLLGEIGGPVGPVPPGQACSMIYGGPQTAEVRGTWGGRSVAESYRRTNGCEVSRWSRMVPVLPGPDNGGTRPALTG